MSGAVIQEAGLDPAVCRKTVLHFFIQDGIQILPVSRISFNFHQFASSACQIAGHLVFRSQNLFVNFINRHGQNFQIGVIGLLFNRTVGIQTDDAKPRNDQRYHQHLYPQAFSQGNITQNPLYPCFPFFFFHPVTRPVNTLSLFFIITDPDGT